MTDILTTIIKIPLDLWKAVTGSVDVVFLDTHQVRSYMFLRRRKSITIAKREYIIVPNMIKAGSIFFVTSCSEPAKVGTETVINPVQPELSYEKSVYYFDTYETYLKLRNTIIEKMMVSNIPKKIDLVLIGLALNFLVCLYIAYKIGKIPGIG